VDILVDSRGDPLVALLVEASAGDRARIALRLESAGASASDPAVRLLHAEAVAGACLLLAETRVDVVILDLSLPDIGGLEALRRVRAAAPSVPVVVLTDTADEGVALQALRAGAQDYVLKPPPDGPALRRILRYARERHHLMQELNLAAHESAKTARQWRLLAEIGDALAGSDDLGTGVAGVAGLVVPKAADFFVFYLVGHDDLPSMVEVGYAEQGRGSELRDSLRDPSSAVGAAAERLVRAMAAADSVTRAEEGNGNPASAFLTSLGASWGMAAPLHVGGQVRGVVVLATNHGPREADADLAFGRSLADRLGLALERDRLLRHLHRAVAARDRAVGIVSHDLGNLLGTVQICVTALLDPEPPSMNGMRNMAQLIQRSAASMQQIVQDLLDRAALDAGRLTLERQPTAVGDVVGGAQVMFSPVAEERGLEFVVESEADLPPVNADPRRLLQVLANLLSNAMKFTAPGGRVVLSAAVSPEEHSDARLAGGGAIRFAVSDTGTGIPPEDLAHVFDWFWRSRPGGRSGTGLGLAIAKGLIEAHGGRLGVESVPGRGSNFWFSVPMAGDSQVARS
jgi:signal transduction histidine kinase/DNA-binding NarL/FixJ family response regulator